MVKAYDLATDPEETQSFDCNNAALFGLLAKLVLIFFAPYNPEILLQCSLAFFDLSFVKLNSLNFVVRFPTGLLTVTMSSKSEPGLFSSEFLKNFQ